MKKLALVLSAITLTVIGFQITAQISQAGEQDNQVEMYRLYNPNTGEHFYTAKAGEKDSLSMAGWDYEGIGWVAPTAGDPVYRLYNPNAGDHHYTTSASEKKNLVRSGWRDEGIGWYSGGNVAVYRQYNPHAKSGSHNYTTSKSENDNLIRAGWKSEGIGWKCVEKGQTATQPKSNSIKKSNGKVDYYEAYHDVLAQLLQEKLHIYRNNWKSASINSALTYTLYDLTGDGIKELLVSWTLVQSDATIYVYSYDGKQTSNLKFAGDQFVGRHEELRPSGNDIVYGNVDTGIVNVARVRWNGTNLTREWIAHRSSWDVSEGWLDSIYKSLHCGTPLKMYPANDLSLLRNS